MRVGLIGCGRIALEAHLPAYKHNGVEVVGVCDIVAERAMHAAQMFGINYHTTNALELAQRLDVELLDIATRPEGRPALLRSLKKFKKPILVQKPLCYSLEEACNLQQEFEEADIPLAVNHNARWAPVNQQVMDWIDSGKLGNLYSIHHVNRFNEDIRAWYTDFPDYLFLDHGIHYIDLVRCYTRASPNFISATCGKKPNQKAQCPLLYTITMRYESAQIPVVSLYFNNAVPTSNSFHCSWYIDGEKGSVHATLDSLSYATSSGHFEPMRRLPGDWVPDGFYGAYNSFVKSINHKVPAPHSAADHLLTFKIACAAAESAKRQGEWIEIR